MFDKSKGFLILLTGVSASGKSYLMNNLKKEGFVESISHTTRKPRLGEVDGEHFYYIEEEDVSSINFIESDRYAGKFYGTSKKEIESKLSNNKYVFAIVNETGVKNLKKIYSENVKKVFISIDEKTMKDRLEKRVADGKINLQEMHTRLREVSNNGEFFEFHDADLVLDGTNPNNMDVLLEYLETFEEDEEIERKFILDSDKYFYSNMLKKKTYIYELEQYYRLAENRVERFRRKHDIFTMENVYKKEIKSQDLGIKRKEVGFKLSKDEYNKAIKNLDLFIKKKRVLKEYNQDGLIHIAEIDTFKDKNMKEILVEFEFFNEKRAKAFKMPSWCSREVTNDENYRNLSIAKKLRKKRLNK